MPSSDDIKHQQTMLKTYRDRLRVQLQQEGTMGNHTPAYVRLEIDEARRNIQRVKQILRGWGVAVQDQPDDKAETEDEPSMPATTPRPSGGSIFNNYGTFNSGLTNVGGVQNIKEVDITMGDTFDFSGANISGANLNIKSTLTNVTQTIGSLPNTDDATKQELAQLMAELQDALQQLSDRGHAAEAETIAKRAGALVEQVGQEQPDKELATFNGESLKKAAQNIAAIVPSVLAAATKIVDFVRPLIGL